MNGGPKADKACWEGGARPRGIMEGLERRDAEMELSEKPHCNKRTSQFVINASRAVFAHKCQSRNKISKNLEKPKQRSPTIHSQEHQTTVVWQGGMGTINLIVPISCLHIRLSIIGSLELLLCDLDWLGVGTTSYPGSVPTASSLARTAVIHSSRMLDRSCPVLYNRLIWLGQ